MGLASVGREGLAQWEGRTFRTVLGEIRYSLYQPTQMRGGLPLETQTLALFLHGCNQTPVEFYQGARLAEKAEKFGVVVVVPHQRPGAHPEGCWNWYDPFNQTRYGVEPRMLQDLVTELVKSLGFEKPRIWIGGMSSGAAMANIMLSCFPETFVAGAFHSGLAYLAASSPISAVWSIGHGSTVPPEYSALSAFQCSGFQKVRRPVILIHGSEDQRVVPVHSEEITRQFQVLSDYTDDGFWNGSSGLRGPFLQSAYSPRESQYPYRIEDYRDQDKVWIRRISVDGLAHAWSGGDPAFPRTDERGPDFSQLAFEFWTETKGERQ